MAIDILQSKSPAQVCKDVKSFPCKYVQNWDEWLNASNSERPELFGKTLGKWNAVRPRKRRRLKSEADHKPPYLDDLLKKAKPLIYGLGSLTVADFKINNKKQACLEKLWQIFSCLPQSGQASCVGITKAVLLLTNGKIGPAFDTMVRKSLGLRRHIQDANEWIGLLGEVSNDIKAFEHKNRKKFADVVPPKFKNIEYGRLYDMVLGPRQYNKCNRQ